MTRRIGVGLVSAGWMGTVHSRGYLGVRDKYPELGLAPELVVVADTVAANAQRLVDRLGYARATADHRDVLADPAVDVVSICAPNYLHRELAEAAAAAGKPFWIEKPMGAGPADSRAIAAAAAAAGVVTAVGFNYRHAPGVAHLRDLVRSGRLGRVTNVRVRFDADYASSPDGPRTWRFVTATAGSGVLGDLLSHGFDLAQYVLADPITDVHALTATFVPERPEATVGGIGHQVASAADAPMLPVENEDWAAVHARFGSGAVGTFESSRVAVGPRCEYSITVHGTAGSASWDFERMNELAVCLRDEGPYGYTRVLTDPTMGDFGRFQVGAGMGLSFDDLKVVEARLFLGSVVTGCQLAPSVADGLAAASVAAAAEASAADGTWHAVPAPQGPTTFDA